MNYWKQFVEMLGLELDEEFSLAKPNGEKVTEDKYKITERGLYYKPQIGINRYYEAPIIIYNLLNGKYKAVPKPWKPKNGDVYWYYRILREEASWTTWSFDSIDFCRWNAGNCFKTEKEAMEKGREIMKAIRKEFEEA